MTLVQIIALALQISIALIVVSVAVRAAPGDLTYLLRKPSLLLRSLLAMNVVMPFLAALISLVFHIRLPVEVALILLAVSPVPPILPGKETKAGGNVSYGISLLWISALLSIVTVPVSVTLIGRLFGVEIHVPIAAIAMVVGKSVLAPLLIGIVVGRLAPSVAPRLARPLSRVGTVVLVLGLLPILVKLWPAVAAAASLSSIVAIVLFAVLSLAVGHVLGGPARDDRMVLGLSTASRHPGVAMAVASAALSPEQKPVVVGAVVLCVLVGSVVTAPYAKWRPRGQTAVGPGA